MSPDTDTPLRVLVAGADVEPQPFHRVVRGVLLTGRGSPAGRPLERTLEVHGR